MLVIPSHCTKLDTAETKKPTWSNTRSTMSVYSLTISPGKPGRSLVSHPKHGAGKVGIFETHLCQSILRIADILDLDKGPFDFYLYFGGSASLSRSQVRVAINDGRIEVAMPHPGPTDQLPAADSIPKAI